MHYISDELVIKAAAGEISAFEDIYRATSGFVYNIALRVTNNRSDADEVTQDVFLKAYDKIGSFEFRSSFKTWIYRIAVNTAINYCKRQDRTERRSVEYNPAIHDVAAPDKSDEVLHRQDIENRVVSALAKLDPDQRACIILREMEGLDYRSIADTLNIKINTVRSRLKRARERLLTLRGKE
jgi:RNA polymerase sigma-70 factor (ECF subfamily)